MEDFMSVYNEDSKNNQYIFKYENDCFSEVITYRKYLIESIKSHPMAIKNEEVQNFSSLSVSDKRWEHFIRIARNAGYTIYKVEKL